MDAEPWKRVDDLLQSALQARAEQQEDFLRQQSGGDSELLEEVRSLLTSHRKAGSFLGSPGLHVADVAAQLLDGSAGASRRGSCQRSAGEDLPQCGCGRCACSCPCRLQRLPHALERRRPRHPDRQASQGRVCEVVTSELAFCRDDDPLKLAARDER